MQEHSESALVMLQQEAIELLALFDQLRGDAALAHGQVDIVASVPAGCTEQTAHVSN
ncbi:hypothetical protein [Xanthomonas arboricola]|uniref:hypothetical protein n=1 Tax=Xanthomonas arboricola TaxID=56448 RepID=UPI0015595A03|nr:hypothetical protein [Xanthomonas arboricola]